MQILSRMQEAAGDFARAISRVLGVDVEIVDDSLLRVAGTGRFEPTVGRSLAEAGRAYTRVMETGRPLVVREPGFEEVCRSCPRWRSCEETFEMSTPILYGGKVIGVIGFVCFTQEQRRHILDNFATFSGFLAQMGGLIASKASEMQDLERSRALGELLEGVMDKVDEGVLMLGGRGRVIRANRAARAILRLEERKGALPPISLLRGQGRMLDAHEYEAVVGGRRHYLVGEEYALRRGECECVFVFRDAQILERDAMLLSLTQERVGLDAIIGNSASVLELKAQVRRLASSASSVLILGESGTGKELVARALYEECRGLAGPFVAVNCGAIPENLLESELFGYVRGAFTGAHPRGRIGRFEQASGGVLFLDEIGDLQLHLQAKILRALEQREITRLGATAPIPVRTRVVAATNRNLDSMVSEGSFREDLYYRLNVIPVRVPPLRERGGDVRLLAGAFAERYAQRLEKSLVRIDPDFWETLEAYSWPGNVRELQNAVEFAVNMLESPGVLRRELLPARVRLQKRAPAADGLNLVAMERELIRRALEPYGGASACKREKLQAAESLGIGIATLYRKIREHRLS